MTTLPITDADRDASGRIRTVADLLPQVASQPTQPRPWTRAEIASCVVLALFAIAILAYVRGAETATPTTLPLDPAVISTAAPASPQPSPQPTLAPVVKRPAFDSPDGRVLGEVEVTRGVVPVAHYDSDWIQARVEGSGLVWLRAADWPALAVTGPNLAPRDVVAEDTLAPVQVFRGAPVVVAPPTLAPEDPPAATVEKPSKDRSARYAAAVERLRQERFGTKEGR